MSDHSELIEQISDEADLCRNDGADDIAELLDTTATAIRDLIAERDAAHAKGWNEAIEAGARVSETWPSQQCKHTFIDCDEAADEIATAIRAMRKDA